MDPRQNLLLRGEEHGFVSFFSSPRQQNQNTKYPQPGWFCFFQAVGKSSSHSEDASRIMCVLNDVMQMCYGKENSASGESHGSLKQQLVFTS